MDLLYCTVRAVLLLLNLAKILLETLLFSCCWWSLSACKTIQSLTLSVINIFNLSFYSSCFLFNCLLSFCYFMHCVHTNVITSQCWSCSNQFPSVELIRSSASISADHFCQHVVFGFGICLFLPPFFFFVAHSGRNVRADYQKQSSSHRMMVTFDKSDSAAEKKKKKSWFRKALFNSCLSASFHQRASAALREM